MSTFFLLVLVLGMLISGAIIVHQAGIPAFKAWREQRAQSARIAAWRQGQQK